VALSFAVGLAAAACTAPSKATLGHAPKGQFGNGKETLDYVNGLNFSADSGLVVQYTCEGCPAGISLLIIPEKHAEQQNWQADLGDGHAGDVVAQVINVGSVEVPGLGLGPTDVAYAWVGQIGPNSTDRGFGIYRLDSTGTTAGTADLTAMDKIAFCKNNAPRSKPSIKRQHPGGGTCEPIKAASIARARGLAWLSVPVAHAAVARSATASLNPGVGQLWISCSGGCCQVSTD
jgi:hypothetical protein